MYLDWIDNQEALFASKLSQNEAQIDAEHSPASLPRSYSSHTAQEEAIIHQVNQYQKDFRGIYTNRRDLFLLPKNEFGVEKFLCSYIKPTRLPYADLQDYRSISKFIAELIKYQPLDKTYDPPQVVNSPTLTVRKQSGNSLDLSVLLCSLLIGAGYNAYVVYGYASQRVTMKDDSGITYDMDEMKEIQQFDLKEEEDATNEEIQQLKYRIKPPKQVKSKFLSRNDKQEVEETKIEQADAQEVKVEAIDHGLRVHFWVLVLLENTEPFFIEPSTGKSTQTDNSEYLGLECAFNHLNYWINMQPCVDALNGISFDLGNHTNWEFIFPENNVPGMEGDGMAFASIEISQKLYQQKYPIGGLVRSFQNAKVSLFARRSRPDGLVKRIEAAGSVYEWFEDRRDKLIVRIRVGGECREIFARGRNDAAREIRFKGKITDVFFYDEARVDGLSHKQLGEKTIEHYKERDDCLVKRKISNSKVTEFYSNKVHKKVFGNTLRIVFKRENERLLSRTIEFPRHFDDKFNPEFVTQFDPNPHAEPQTELEKLYEQLIEEDMRVKQAVKNSEREFNELIKQRQEEETKLEFEQSAYEQLELPQETVTAGAVQVKQEEEIIDYLSPYLHLDPFQIRDQCLKALKERILDQAAIIQARYESYSNELERKQKEYTRNQDSLTSEEKEEFKHWFDEQTFKISIVEKRLQKHKESAAEKYLNMDKKLRADKRLEKFLNKEC